MKNFHFFSALATMLLFTLQLSLHAQTTATWQGGKPGKTTDWNCAFNWKEGRTPDEFCLIIIPSGKTFYPVLNATVPAIDALLVESGATLTIQKGAYLNILGQTGRMGGVTLVGTVLNEGIFEINRAPKADIAFMEHIQGGDVVAMEGTVIKAAR